MLAMSTTELFTLLAMAALVWFWFDGLKAREIAVAFARSACDRTGLQFLDETVALRSLRTTRDAHGHLVWKRLYGFEFSRTGVDRLQATVLLHGSLPVSVDLRRSVDVASDNVVPFVVPSLRAAGCSASGPGDGGSCGDASRLRLECTALEIDSSAPSLAPYSFPARETQMTLVRPFPALRPAPGRAPEVVAPPYDVLNTEEARALAAGRPYSFLHISKPEIDLPAGTDPYAPEVYAKAAENLQAMIAAGILVQDDAPCYYAYRLIMADHVQTGIVAAASVADYDTNRIRKHEFTRPDKEDDRVRQIEALNAQTGPVLLAYPNAPEIDALLSAATQAAPDADATAETGVRHSLWVIRDAPSVARLTALFDALPALYIADGHHRSASASRICAARKAANPQHSGDEPYNYFLTVIFPDHQMKIFDYNRVIKDLNGLSEAEFLDRIAAHFTVELADGPVKPAQSREFGLYMGGRWRRLQIHPSLVPTDPVERLDVSLLQNHLITPILGITDPRRDKRIDFVGGIRGLAELEKRVDSGDMALAFALHPTHMEHLIAVADANQVMPPKSTWFEPKLADGMASHLL